jgi:hypothetical protein
MIICGIRDSIAPAKVQLVQGPNGIQYTLRKTVPGAPDSNDKPTTIEITDFTTSFNPVEISALPDLSDYALMTRGIRLPSEAVVNLGLGINRLANLYQITMASRMTIDDYLHQNGFHLMAAVIVPLDGSSSDTWVLAIPCKGGIVECNSPIVYVSSWDECLDNYMPRIQPPVTHDITDGIARVMFGIQMPNLQPVALKPWLFFEVTAGSLHTTRAQYGDPCILDVSKLASGTEVRIKAGFKYRPGQADYTFTV